MSPEIQQLTDRIQQLELIVNVFLIPGGYQFRKDTKLGLNNVGVTVGATGGRVGFFGSTPAIQQTPAGETVMGINAGTNATNTSTWTGSTGATAYTVGDVVKILKAHGILKQ